MVSFFKRLSKADINWLFGQSQLFVFKIVGLTYTFSQVRYWVSYHQHYVTVCALFGFENSKLKNSISYLKLQNSKISEKPRNLLDLGR